MLNLKIGKKKNRKPTDLYFMLDVIELNRMKKQLQGQLPTTFDEKYQYIWEPLISDKMPEKLMDICMFEPRSTR